MNLTKQEALKKLEVMEKDTKELKSYIEGLYKKKYWDPNYNDEYWYIGDDVEVYQEVCIDGLIDNDRLEMGNVYKTKEEAEKQVELTKAIVRVKQFIAENCEEFEPDWSNGDQRKYEVYCDSYAEEIRADSMFSYKSATLLPYLKTKEDAQKVIDNCEKDLKLIFGL